MKSAYLTMPSSGDTLALSIGALEVLKAASEIAPSVPLLGCIINSALGLATLLQVCTLISSAVLGKTQAHKRCRKWATPRSSALY